MNFHVVGGKKSDIDFWAEDCKSLNNIYFHGFIKPEKTYQYRNLCDILLAPYQTNEEGNRNSEYMSPIKIFEYMASKKAIICSDLPAIRETVTEREAVFVDNKNFYEWEKALAQLAINSKKREDLANNAYHCCINNFTYKSRCTKILNFMFTN